MKRFEEDSWKSRCSRFVFCTSQGLEDTKLVEEIEKQTTRLASEKIEFVTWGATELSEKLKDHPLLVDDFFGRAWVEYFCGSDAAKRMGDRLDGAKLATLRIELRKFYQRVFRQHDPGISSPSAGPVPDLETRYVFPRILVTRESVRTTVATELDIDFDQPDPDRSEWQPEPIIDARVRLDERAPITGQSLGAGFEQELHLEEWIESSARLMIFGPPGAGKSSLLRFLALDTLCDSPRLKSYAQLRPGCIPIWIPFGFWTELVRNEGIHASSVTSCVSSWLESHDAEELFDLVSPALSDHRALLLVDGTDEWRTPDCASLVMQRLMEFVDKHEIPLICSSRPYGLERATPMDPTIRAGSIAALDSTMQRNLAETWLSYWLKEERKAGTPTVAAREAQAFSQALALRSDMAVLATIPMLFVLLAHAWLRERVLPDNVFAAYEQLVRYLLTEHPRRRAAAASVREHESKPTDHERLELLSFLAFGMQERGAYVEDRETLRAELARRLREDGFGHQEARQVSDAVVGQTTDAPAVLVSTSHSHVAFLHRSLLEHLAARWILQLRTERQVELVTTHLPDPRWTEVILNLVQGARRDDRDQLVVAIQAGIESHPHSATPRIVLAELTFGKYGLTPAAARALSPATFDYVECGSSGALRQRLVRTVVTGLQSPAIRSFTHDRLARWFPSGTAYRTAVYGALGSLTAADDLRHVLHAALNDDDSRAQRSAAEAFAVAFASDSAAAQVLLREASNPNRPNRQAAILHALNVGWHNAPTVSQLAEEAIKSPSETVRLVGHVIRAKLGLQQRLDRDDLVKMISRRGDLAFGWTDLAVSALATGWKHDESLRDLVCEQLATPVDRQILDEEAWTLAAGLPADQRVASQIVAALRAPSDHRVHQEWFWLCAANFCVDPEVTAAVEGWITQHDDFDNWDYAAACAFPTEHMKDVAIRAARARKGFYFWPLRALVQGWTLDDPAVAALADEFLEGSPLDASYASPWVKQLRGSNYAREHVHRLLQDSNCRRPDIVIQAVKAAPDEFELTAIADSVVAGLSGDNRHDFEPAFFSLLALGVSHRELNKAVEDTIARRNAAAFSSALRGYGNDPTYREGLLAAAVPGSKIVRRAMVDQFERLPDNTHVTSLLSQWRSEEDAVVRSSALNGYASRFSITEAEFVGQLIEETTCYGPRYEERREVAFCQLLSFGKIELLTDRTEQIGRGDKVRIPVGQWHRVNPTSTRLLAQHWDYLRKTWPEDYLARISSRLGHAADEFALLSRMADWVDVETALAAHLVRLVETAEPQPFPGLIAFLARAMPGSPLLLDQCLRALGVRGSSESQDSHALAADVLANQFANDAIRDEIILSAEGQFPRPGALIAMCRGWPSHQWLDDAWERAAFEDARSSELGIVELTCARASALSVAAMVCDLVKSRQPRLPERRRSMLPAFVRRAHRDADFVAHLEKMMRGADSDLSAQVAGARLLAASRSRPETVRAWGVSLLAAGAQRRLWPTAFDVITGRLRCVQDLVWEMLGTSG